MAGQGGRTHLSPYMTASHLFLMNEDSLSYPLVVDANLALNIRITKDSNSLGHALSLSFH